MEALVLDPGEAQWLAAREAIIEPGRQTFVEVGAALLEIRDDPRKVYRIHGTFEEYCRDRWGFTRQHAYQLMGGAQVVETLKMSTTVDILPTTERQARPLALLPAEAQAEAWGRVLAEANGAPVTARQVEKVVRVLKNETTNVHVSDDSYEWYTPCEYIDAAREVMGSIDLDPATHIDAQPIVMAGRVYTRAEDGLAQEWRGRVWLNPPFSADLVRDFTLKLWNEWSRGNVTAAILLVNNATDTQWFQRFVMQFPVCLTLGRVRFWKPGEADLAARQGQAIFSIGNDVARFNEVFSRFGTIMVPYGYQGQGAVLQQPAELGLSERVFRENGHSTSGCGRGSRAVGAISHP